MTPLYKIVSARRRDVHLIGAIELAAATLLWGHAPNTVLNQTTPEQTYEMPKAKVGFGLPSQVILRSGSHTSRCSRLTQPTWRRSMFIPITAVEASAGGS